MRPLWGSPLVSQGPGGDMAQVGQQSCASVMATIMEENCVLNLLYLLPSSLSLF